MSHFDFLKTLTSECKGELFRTLPYRERELVKLVSGEGAGYSYSIGDVAYVLRTSPERIQDLIRIIRQKFHFFEFTSERKVSMPNKRVLLVDKDVQLAEIVEYNLQKVGYFPVIAHSGSEGFQIASSDQPDVIVLELQLPDMDGLDLVRLLLGSHKTQHIPIIILTSKSEESDQLIGFSLGAQDYITKPFSVRVFLARLKRVLLHRPRNTEINTNPNTVMNVSPVFNNRQFESRSNQAFTLMPITAPWSDRVWQRL